MKYQKQIKEILKCWETNDKDTAQKIIIETLSKHINGIMEFMVGLGYTLKEEEIKQGIK